MRKATIKEGRICPKCGSIENQVDYGYNRSGTQKSRCQICKRIYTVNPKVRAYPDEVREAAIKMYYSGVSGRGVGKALGINKSNTVRWIKKTERAVDKS
jgi:transposase-like protein